MLPDSGPPKSCQASVGSDTSGNTFEEEVDVVSGNQKGCVAVTLLEAPDRQIKISPPIVRMWVVLSRKPKTEADVQGPGSARSSRARRLLDLQHDRAVLCWCPACITLFMQSHFFAARL